MVLTRENGHANRIKVLALHGMTKDAWHRFGDEGYKHYQVVECGFKYNMMDLQAAIGIHQLQRLNENWRRREEIWGIYQQAFQDLPLTLPAPPADETRHAYHLYTIQVDVKRAGVSRDEFLVAMANEHIGVGVHYLSIPMHPYYQERFGWRSEAYPYSHRIGLQTVSLPLSPKLSDGDVADVIAAVHRSLAA